MDGWITHRTTHLRSWEETKRYNEKVRSKLHHEIRFSPSLLLSSSSSSSQSSLTWILNTVRYKYNFTTNYFCHRLHDLANVVLKSFVDFAYFPFPSSFLFLLLYFILSFLFDDSRLSRSWKISTRPTRNVSHSILTTIAHLGLGINLNKLVIILYLITMNNDRKKERTKDKNSIRIYKIRYEIRVILLFIAFDWIFNCPLWDWELSVRNEI